MIASHLQLRPLEDTVSLAEVYDKPEKVYVRENLPRKPLNPLAKFLAITSGVDFFLGLGMRWIGNRLQNSERFLVTSRSMYGAAPWFVLKGILCFFGGATVAMYTKPMTASKRIPASVGNFRE